MYAMPATMDEALDLVRQPGARVVAGGTDYYPSLGEGLPDHPLVDLTRVSGLRGIRPDGAGWRIGAATTWTDILRADLPRCFDGLKAAAREVGSVQIQNAGTLAGNLCNASPAADGVPPLLTLEAEVILTGPSSERRLPVGAFITGVRQTALTQGEIVSAVVIPAQPAGALSAFEKLGARRYLVISIAMVAVVVWLDGGQIAGARVAVGACGPVACRLTALEAAMIGLTPGDLADPAIVKEAHLAPLSPLSDVRGSEEYRLESVAELCRRALLSATGAA